MYSLSVSKYYFFYAVNFPYNVFQQLQSQISHDTLKHAKLTIKS